jgi:transposase
VGLAEQVERLRAENADLAAKNAELTVQNQELAAEHQELAANFAELAAKLEALEAELERLRREMGRNSGNSGKPPSSDTLAQRAEQAEQVLSRAERRRQAREKAKKLFKGHEKRRPGKQPGGPGLALAKVPVPDKMVAHPPERCRRCGESLEGAPVTATEVRQVFDLPERRLQVTEHVAESRRCACGALTKAAFPAEATAATCYGPVVRATALYLMAGQHVPVARTAALMSQVCGAPVSTGWLAGLPGEAAAGLSPFLDELRAQLAAEDVLHADETGSRISGARYWFHVACTGLLTLLDCHEKRGAGAFADMGVLPLFSGVLVSDGWKPYWSIDGIEHALCCAHLLRDLASLTGSALHRDWADDMADLLVEAKNAVEASVDGKLSSSQLKAYRARYTKLINRGVSALPARHRPGSVHRDAYNLLRRLRDQQEEVTRYWSDPRVSFDNNQAERDLRMAKLQQKISGCFRTVVGAKAFCAVRSYLQTAQKHGLQGLDVLVQLFRGSPWLPPTVASPP